MAAFHSSSKGIFGWMDGLLLSCYLHLIGQRLGRGQTHLWVLSSTTMGLGVVAGTVVQLLKHACRLRGRKGSQGGGGR